MKKLQACRWRYVINGATPSSSHTIYQMKDVILVTFSDAIFSSFNIIEKQVLSSSLQILLRKKVKKQRKT